ncbi:hypothetical protein JL720_10460 [Aureococcus anophagefferens]|nr:hypothetical protein JL720_10460 [Aureococcus anophagefferens]
MFFRKKRPDARKAADPETAPPAAADPETDPPAAPPAAPIDASPPEGLSPTSPAVVSRASDDAASPGAAARVPEQYVCRISNEVMRDPVVLADGYSYERRAAEAWLAARDTSPATNRPLDHTLSCPNRDLADLIRGDPRYGFVRRDGGGDDLFVHRANVRRHGALEAGDAVEFVVAWDGRVGRLEARDGDYGFIRPDDGSPDVFVHAAATGDVPGPRGRRPRRLPRRVLQRARPRDARRAAASLVVMAPIGHRPPGAAPIGPPGAEAYRPVLDKQTSLARSVFARADSDRGEPPPEEASQIADDFARAQL